MIGNKITKIREEKNISKNQLAIKANISFSELIDIEKGKRIPQAKTLKKIAEALDVDIIDLC